jgi:CheY-like chemotaxis protein
MDHSYRVVNGNFADTPPSTMDSHNGNYQGRSNGGGRSYQSDSQPIDYSQGRAIPIPDDAPTKIFFFIEDLFFIAKIQETARKLGVKVGFVKNDKESIAALVGVEEEDRPGLIVFDLNNANAKPLTLIPKLKTKLKKSTSIVGFLSHLQGDLKAKAVEAGCDTVMPRAAFSQNLPNLLRRYGTEEEEEPTSTSNAFPDLEIKKEPREKFSGLLFYSFLLRKPSPAASPYVCPLANAGADGSPSAHLHRRCLPLSDSRAPACGHVRSPQPRPSGDPAVQYLPQPPWPARLCAVSE